MKYLAILLFGLIIGVPMAQGNELARGISYSNTNESAYTLNKNSSPIITSYELKLAIYFAVRDGKKFQLKIPEKAQVDDNLEKLIAKNGGVIINTEINNYTAYIGHMLPDGSEGDGWVLGDETAWKKLTNSQSKIPEVNYLSLGQRISQNECSEILSKNNNIKTQMLNIDQENIGVALKSLFQSCATQGGYLFIQ